MKKKVYFRADAGASIGYGHFIRSLALADMLKEHFSCTFFTSCPTPYQVSELAKVCNYVPLSENTKFDDFLALLIGDEIVVLDNYFFTTEYQRQIKARGCSLVCIDDMHDRHYVADVVINQGAKDPTLFSIDPHTRLCMGYDWLLLRQPFWDVYNSGVRNDNIVICFGGSDPYCLTEKVLSILSEINVPNRIVAISSKSLDLSMYENLNCELRHGLSAEQMADLFSTSLFGIVSASTVFLEGLSQRLPMIVGYYVDNQFNTYKNIESNQYGVTVGNWQEITLDCLANAMQQLEHFEVKSLNLRGTISNYQRLFQSIS